MADTIDAGDLIAPLGLVLERLEGKITIADAEALVAAFAEERIRQVKPGDLITAHLCNQLLVDVEGLRRRLTVLEGSANAPRLDRLEPDTGIRVGSLVTLHGTGFDPRDSSRRLVVQFGEVEIDGFQLGSAAGKLIVLLPDAFGTLPKGVSVRIWVGTRASNALKATVHPRAAPQQGGEVIATLIRSANQPPGNIRVGSNLTYVWQVESQATGPADYSFDLGITNISGATEAAWRQTLTIGPAAVRLGTDETTEIKAAVTVPPGALKASVSLVVKADAAIAQRLPPPVEVTIDAPPDVSEPRAKVDFDRRSGTFDQVRKITLNGQELDGLKVAPGGPEVQLVLAVEPQQIADGRSGKGAYDFEVEFEGGAENWSGRVSPQKVSDIAVGARQQVTLFIANSAAAGTGTVRMLRVWARHRPSPSAAIDFSSFHRFPVDARG